MTRTDLLEMLKIMDTPVSIPDMPQALAWVSPTHPGMGFEDCGSYEEDLEALRTAYPEAKEGVWYWVLAGSMGQIVSVWEYIVDANHFVCVWIDQDIEES